MTVVFPAPSGPSNVIKYPLMSTPTWHCTVKEKRKTDLFFQDYLFFHKKSPPQWTTLSSNNA